MTIPTEPKPTSPAMTEGGLAEIERRWESLGPLEYGQYQSMANYADEVIPYLIKAVRSLASARAAVGGEPVGYFVYDEAWKAWHQVVDSAKGDDGVVALYATPSIPDAGSAGDVGHVAKMIRQWVAEGNSGSLIERSESLADAVLKALAARAGDQP